MKNYCIFFTNEYARLDPITSKLEFSTVQDVFSDLKADCPIPTNTIYKIVFDSYLYSMKSLSKIIECFEQEVHAIHSTSYNISYDDRYN